MVKTVHAAGAAGAAAAAEVGEPGIAVRMGPVTSRPLPVQNRRGIATVIQSAVAAEPLIVMPAATSIARTPASVVPPMMAPPNRSTTCTAST